MSKTLKEQLEAIRPRIKTPKHGKTKIHKDRKKEEKKNGPKSKDWPTDGPRE